MAVTNVNSALSAYGARASALRARYDAIATEEVLSSVIDLVPPPPKSVLDVGAGTGRDAVWFSARGHRVTAVEPVAEFRDSIEARLPGGKIFDARLPELEGIAGPFDLILVNGVWHHLTKAERVASIARFSALLARAGRLILSLRHGPAYPDMPIHPLHPEDEIDCAEAVGLVLLRRTPAPSLQAQNIAAGVTWTWLVFEKDSSK